MTKAAASNAANTNRMLVQARFGALDRRAVLSPSWLGHKHKRRSTFWKTCSVWSCALTSASLTSGGENRRWVSPVDPVARSGFRRRSSRRRFPGPVGKRHRR